MQQSNDKENEVQGNFVRMNLNVAPDVPEKLRELAGGKFKMGMWLSDLIQKMYDNRPPENVSSIDVEGLRLLVMGLAGQMQMLKGEMTQTQSQVAALVAQVQKGNRV